jgi:hypothetical protein
MLQIQTVLKDRCPLIVAVVVWGGIGMKSSRLDCFYANRNVVTDDRRPKVRFWWLIYGGPWPFVPLHQNMILSKVL